MRLIEDGLGKLMNLVDRKAGWQMSKFRQMHQWPIVFGLVTMALAFVSGSVDGGAEGVQSILKATGLPDVDALAEVITVAGFYIGGHFLTTLNRRAGRDEDVVQR